MKKNVIEIHSIQEVPSFLQEDTHLFLDLDNTLLTSCSEFGSERWERFMIDHFIREGIPEKQAVARASHLWKAVQTVSQIQFVEEITQATTRHMQTKVPASFVITARDYSFRSVTEDQINHLNLKFSESKPLPIAPAQYANGIFYCGDVPKGAVLKAYAEKYGCKHILLVDDYRSHVEVAAEMMPIDFTGLRYGFLDERKSKYTPCEITQLLGKIFTHKEACRFLRNGIVHSDLD